MSRRPSAPAGSVGTRRSNPLALLITRFRTPREGERDLYADLKELLTRETLGIGLAPEQVVVDSPMLGGQRAPDIALYMTAADGRVLKTPDHAMAMFEIKIGDALVTTESALLIEKQGYVQPGTQFFFLVDQTRVIRHDADAFRLPPNERRASLAVPAAIPGRREWLWDDLHDTANLQACFGPISPRGLALDEALAKFRRQGEPYARLRVEDGVSRRNFVDTVRNCLRLASDVVRTVVQGRVTSDLLAAERIVERFAADWGAPTYEFGVSPGRVDFADIRAAGGRALAPDQVRAYHASMAVLSAEIEPLLYALRIEHSLLPFYAERLGLAAQGAKRPSLTKASYAGNKPTVSGQAVETFVYETATLLTSRMLMIRFAEDHGFLRKMISNGGIEAFSGFATYSDLRMQELVRMTYDRARPLYAGLFAPNILDWVLETNDPSLDTSLLHALWLLNRWDFRTVDGDVLSGVYDKYLDPRRRRALGEVFTRPEVARHLLEVCTRGRPDATVLDPACGSGTFIVERLAMEVDRLRGLGMLNIDTAATVLGRIAGLDLNPFSVSLTQMQMLWHMVELLGGLSGDGVQVSVRRLVGAIRVAGGHTSLDTFGMGGARGQRELDLDVNQGPEGTSVARVSGLFKAIATAEYDAVVGNPPFVRAQRLSMPESIRREYADVLTAEADLYVAFVKRALEAWVAPGGRLGFIVPLVATTADYAGPMRALVERYRIVELIDFEQVGRAMFRGVKRPALGLVVERADPTDHDEIVLRSLPASSYDAERDELDFGKSIVSQIRRADFLGAYAPSDLASGDVAGEDSVDADEEA